MAAEENRMKNLRLIVDAEAESAGGKLRQAYRAVATRTGLQEEYVYQLYKNIKKAMGPDAARAISRAYADGRPSEWFDEAPAADGSKITTQHDDVKDGTVYFKQYAAGGSMGSGLILEEKQPGIIKSWSVSREWIRLNVPHYTSAANLCIVTGFGPSMKPLYNPGDPLLMDSGVNVVEAEGVYFFRVGNHGFIKQLQRIPSDDGMFLRAKSLNSSYDSFNITERMMTDFACFGKILTVWKSEQV